MADVTVEPATDRSTDASAIGTDAAPPAQWHRGMTIIAAASLFIGARNLWTNAIVHRPVVAAVVSLCYLAILVAAVMALVTRTRRTMTYVDLGVLLTAIVSAGCAYVMAHAPNDEGALTAQAARSLLAGHPVYGVSWPAIFNSSHVGVTYAMNGGADYSYGYPPVAPLLTALVHVIVPGVSLRTCATLVTFGALVAGTVTLWILLPPPWRSAATAVCLGFGLLPGYAALGYPAIIAVALLIPVVVAWPTIGRSGRLSGIDIARAVCLGAACAAQQLPWFLTPFLIVGVFLLRRGHLTTRRAATVTAGFAGIAAATWLLINGYFAIRSGAAWLAGILTPLTQHAVPHGQGLIDISYYFIGGSGALDFYSYATVALAITLLTAYALFIRRLGPAAAVLPWFVFFLSIRSQDGYFLLMIPLWLATAATVPPAAFHAAYLLRGPSRRGDMTSAAIVAALTAITVTCTVIAVATPAPLRVEILHVETGGPGHTGVWGIEARLTNTGNTTLTPHFALSTNQSMSRFWNVGDGPRSLAPGASVLYNLTAYTRGYPLDPHGRNLLRVVTDNPMTLSSAILPESTP